MSAKKKKGSSEALENLQQWSGTVQRQLSGLRSELTKIQKHEEAIDAWSSAEISQNSLQSNSIESILNQLLDRQENFFKEEREHWTAERDNWKRTETELRNEIARLQQLLIPSGTPVATSAAQETKPESRVPAKRDKDDVHVHLGVKESIVAAFSAVDQGDVLADGFDMLLKTSTNGLAKPVSEEKTEAEGNAVETIKSPPTGPPPKLKVGDDDIYWVSQLQEALNQKGYFCGNDDVEDFYFGDGTQSALLTFQACEGVTETGITDAGTWRALLGPELKPVVGNAAVDTTEAEKIEVRIEEEGRKSVEPYPVLSELDGGKDVHCVQVMLEIAGYSCGKDDMQWWHFGDETVAAMKTFQACNGLPESGVADESTWKKLTGPGKTMEDVRRRVKEEELFEEDMTDTNRVWLLGEQRWERKL